MLAAQRLPPDHGGGARGDDQTSHLRPVSQQVPLAERPHWRRDPVIISSSAEVGPATPSQEAQSIIGAKIAH